MVEILYVYGLATSLDSISCMIDDGYKLLFDSGQVHISENFELPTNACIGAIWSSDKNNGLYLLHSVKDEYVDVLEISQDEALWHQSFGHLNHRSLDFMAQRGKILDFSLWNLPLTYVRLANLVSNVEKLRKPKGEARQLKYTN